MRNTLRSQLAEERREREGWEELAQQATEKLEAMEANARCSCCGVVVPATESSAHMLVCDKHPLAAERRAREEAEARLALACKDCQAESRDSRLRRALDLAEEALEAGRDDRWCRNCASTWEEHKHWCSVGNALDEIRKAKEGA